MTKEFAKIIETEEHNEMIRLRYKLKKDIYFKDKSTGGSGWLYWEKDRPLGLDFNLFWYVTPEELPEAVKCDKE